MRVVHAYHYWWPEVGLPNELQALPRNDSADWNDISGEWAVLDNLKNVLGRDLLPFIDDPYRNKFNCGGLLERLKRNNQYNSGHHRKGWGDERHLDLLQSVGGNYVRNVMSHRNTGNVFAFAQRDGKFDLDRWNEEYWRRFEDFVLYCMNNETGERVEWGDYWANYVRRRAEAAGIEIYITDMRRNEDVRSSDHAHIFDHPDLYTFVDISQNNAWAGLGQKPWQRPLGGVGQQGK